MEIKFTVPDPPKGKQRLRICRINERNITYTPKQTTEYEKLVRASYNSVSKVKFQKDKPLEISIISLFSIPQHTSKNLKKLILNGEILPTKKPDSDNVVKAILDALNGVCYHDDNQICKVNFVKIYAENPGVKVRIKELIL